MTTQSDALTIWQSFKDALAGELPGASAELMAAWSNRSARTSFYTSHLFERVAARLKLQVEAERFKIDCALVRPVDPPPLRVPVVLLESENDVWTAIDEIEKLCRLAAPLRVLLTVAEWSQAWPHGGHAQRLMTTWIRPIEACGRSYPQDGCLAIVVGELPSDGDLRFHTVLFNGRGEIAEPSTMLVGQSLSV